MMDQVEHRLVIIQLQGVTQLAPSTTQVMPISQGRRKWTALVIRINIRTTQDGHKLWAFQIQRPILNVIPRIERLIGIIHHSGVLSNPRQHNALTKELPLQGNPTNGTFNLVTLEDDGLERVRTYNEQEIEQSQSNQDQESKISS